MLHTAVMGPQPATMGEVPCSCAQLFLSRENASKAQQLGRAVNKKSKFLVQL